MLTVYFENISTDMIFLSQWLRVERLFAQCMAQSNRILIYQEINGDESCKGEFLCMFEGLTSDILIVKSFEIFLLNSIVIICITS